MATSFLTASVEGTSSLFTVPAPLGGAVSLLDKMKCAEKFLVKKENVIEFLKTHPPQVVMTLGAGDIDSLIEPIEKLLNEKQTS